MKRLLLIILTILLMAVPQVAMSAQELDADADGLIDLELLPYLDEDNMATDSNTKFPTQQSVKAYVSTQISGLSAVYQPLEATLTDIADGTIGENLVNIAYPWADNEVANDITASNYIPLSGFTQDSGILVGTGSGAYQEETGATLRTSIGLGSAATRAAEDTMTDGANLPDGAAVKAYVDAAVAAGGFAESGDYTPTGTWDWSGVNGATTWPTFNQNTTGTAANLSGTPDLPDGTTATTQSPSDNSTDLATTAYTDAAIAALGSAASRAAEDTLTDGSNLPDGAAIKAYGDANWAGGGTGLPSNFSDSSNDIGADDGAQIDDASGDPIMTFGDGQILTIAALTYFQGSTAFEADVNLDDGTTHSPVLGFKNESDEYTNFYQNDDGTFIIDNYSGSSLGIYVYPGASSDLAIIPATDGYGLLLYDVGGNTNVRLSVDDGTDNLLISGDFQFADGNSVLDASGNVVFSINDGQELELVGSLVGLDTISLAAASDYTVGSSSLLDFAEVEGSAITGATSITSAYMNKRVSFTSAATATMAAAGSGGFNYRGCVAFDIRDDSEAAVIDVQAGEKIRLNGTAGSAGVAITATGAGEQVVMCPTTDSDGSGTDGYIAWGPSSGWASQ